MLSGHLPEFCTQHNICPITKWSKRGITFANRSIMIHQGKSRFEWWRMFGASRVKFSYFCSQQKIKRKYKSNFKRMLLHEAQCALYLVWTCRQCVTYSSLKNKIQKTDSESARQVPDQQPWYVRWRPSFLCHIRKPVNKLSSISFLSELRRNNWAWHQVLKNPALRADVDVICAHTCV